MKCYLSEIAGIQIGYQMRMLKGELPAGPFRLIQMRDVDEEGRLETEGLKPLELDSPDRYRIKSGDILFQARGRRHKAFFLRSVPPDTLASNHFYIVRLRDDSILPAYLAWWINQAPAQAQISAHAQRTTMTLVPREAFESLEVEVPALAVQRKIVDIAQLAALECRLITRLQVRRSSLVNALCMKAALCDNSQQK